jgi:hypothetical protein
VWRVLRGACRVTRVAAGSRAPEEKQRYRERAHHSGNRHPFARNRSHAAMVKA